MSIRATSLGRALRGPLSFCLAATLCGCGGDDASGDATSSADASTSSAEVTSTGPETTSTSPGTTAPASSTTADATTGDPDSTGPGTTGPTVGCMPGSPCCNDAGEYEECFIDDVTGLAWELVPQGGNPNVADALAYCDALTLLGSGGWRVPTVDELRSLLRGCPDTASSGACGLTDDCATADCRDDACDGCIDTPNEGPAMFGCYWNPNLQGECSGYWSSTTPGGGLGWLVDFDDATIRQRDATLPAGLVRCVASLQ